MWCSEEEHRKLERRAHLRPELDDGKALVERINRIVEGADTKARQDVAFRYLALLRDKADKSKTISFYVDSGRCIMERAGHWAEVYRAAFDGIERLKDKSPLITFFGDPEKT